GGIMDLTGMADGEPTRIGIPVADIFTGVYSVVGILAALNERERTGKGAHVDTALVDATVAVLANQALNYLVSGNVPKRIGNAHANIVPYQVFEVADGYIIIATGNSNQFVKLCNVLGAPEIANDPQVKHRGMKIERASKAAKAGKIPGVRTPIVIDGWRAASDRPSPLLGEHTEEILREIGEA